MKATRRKFSKELKLEAVRQLEAGLRLADVARALGVDAQVIRRWQDQVRVDPVTAFPGNGRALGSGAESTCCGVNLRRLIAPSSPRAASDRPRG